MAATLGLILACAWPAAGAAPAAASIEPYLAAPTTSVFAPSPTSARLAWVTVQRGGQTLYFGDGRQKTAVGRYEHDDGLVLSNLLVTPDEKDIVFIRDGGVLPNPANDTSPPPRRLLIAAVAGGEPRTIAEGSLSGAVISPDGAHIAYAVGREIWIADRADPTRPRRLLVANGRQRELVFSPDGARLAFISDRSVANGADYAFIGVFDLAAGSLTYLAPGLGTDQSPAWSPDSQSLAFMRVLSAPKSYRFTDYRQGPPFSIVVADVRSGLGRTVFTADLGRGSWFSPFRSVEDYGRVNPGSHLFWTADGRLVFPWEKTGWRLLYAIPAVGGERPRLLTPGGYEVTSAALSPDGRRIVLTANVEAPMRPRAYVLDLADGRRLPVGRVGEMYRDAAFCGDGSCVIAFAWGDTTPQALVVGAGAETRAIDPAELGDPRLRAGFARPAIFSFPSSDGFTIEGVLYRPDGRFAGPRPVVVFAHGGSRSQIFPGRVYAGDSLVQYLVAKGYAVAAINYRSGLGYGLDFREPEKYGGKSEGHGDIDDFVALHRYLSAQPGLDAARVGVFGASFGGYIVSNLLARHSDLYAAGVSLSGVGDWVSEIELDTGSELNFRLSQRAELEDLEFRSSAVARMDGWKSPILLIHGDSDVSGHMEADLEFAAVLVSRGVDLEALILPGETHQLSLWSSRAKAFEATARFFDRTIGDAREKVR